MSLPVSKTAIAVVGLSALLAVTTVGALTATQPWLLTLTALCAALLGGVTVALVAGLARRGAPGGRGVQGHVLFQQLVDGDGDANRLMQDFSDFCARMEKQRTVFAQLALLDPLTGVNNRLGGEMLLTRIGAPLDATGPPLSVAVVDVDNLRELNATQGHAHGDAGLRRVALELETALRAEDWVARWGGDEFLVVCQCRGADMVEVMNRVRRRLGAPRADPGLPAVSISAGVAELGVGEELPACISRADDALYGAKGQGRDRVRVAPAWATVTVLEDRVAFG